jgi:hypothetical protein
MTERRVTTKAELQTDTERTWTALQAALNRLTEAQMTTLKDAQGWSVKDHVIHLTAWERSVLFLLQGKPRHEALGVDEALYLRGDFDAINAAIQQQQQALPLAEALAQCRAVHAQMLAVLEDLTDADLHKTYRHYLPDEPGEGEGPLALNIVYGNTAHHFAEHLDWIEALAGRLA